MHQFSSLVLGGKLIEREGNEQRIFRGSREEEKKETVTSLCAHSSPATNEENTMRLE